MSAVSPARKAAFDILLAVDRGKAHSDDLLRAKAIDALSLPIATSLQLSCSVFFAGRFVLMSNSNPDQEAGSETRSRGFDRPPLGGFSASIPRSRSRPRRHRQSVQLTRQSGHRFASGLVNAVLRKLAVAGPVVDFPEKSAAELALAQAHPAWLVERWARLYGLEAARAICRHGQAQPARAVRLPDSVSKLPPPKQN